MREAQGSTDARVVEQIDALFTGICSNYVRLLPLLAEYDRRGRWKGGGARSMAEWVSARCGISNWAARRWVAAGYALEHLPLIAQSLQDGVLCVDKVVELTRFATPETERKLITWAKRVSAAGIRARADRETRQDLQDTKDAHDGRFLRWFWGDDKRTSLWFEGMLPGAQGAAVAKTITRLADRLPDSPTGEGVATNTETRFEQRCADALSALASQQIAGDADPDRATVVVHAPLESLTTDRGGAEIESGPVIHPATARRLACDARLQFVLTGEGENALGIGFTRRNIPSWVERELRYRDRCCTFPGCERRAFTQGHHILPYPQGPTDLTNLTLVCRFHHLLLHEGGWSVTLDPAGITHWSRPDGRRYLPGPAPPDRLSAYGAGGVGDGAGAPSGAAAAIAGLVGTRTST